MAIFADGLGHVGYAGAGRTNGKRKALAMGPLYCRKLP